MDKYLIEFILNFTIGLIIIVMLPFLMHFMIKDMRIKKQISRGAVSYLQTTNSSSRTKIILFNLSQILFAIIIILYQIFIQIPAISDIPSLIAGNFLTSEGIVSKVENHKSYVTIHINNVEINESTWFKTTIKPNNKYKISYLKYSKYIIKAEKID